MTDFKETNSQTKVPWHRLRAWIDEQEAWEQQHNCPAPLSQAQKSAIQCLIPPVLEPEFGDHDYVSELCHYAQTNRHGMPTYDYASVSKVEMLQPRWRALCTLPWCNEAFPREDYGIEADGESPSFQVKKKAKQFAAKQALMFLHGSPAEPIAKPPSPTSPPNKRIKTEDESINSEDEGPSIYEQVAALASQLGFECPHYRIVKDEDHPNFWKGRPYFKQDAQIPDDLGCVRGMLGRKVAKREMAEQILVWMLAQEQKRDELTNELLDYLKKVKTEE